MRLTPVATSLLLAAAGLAVSTPRASAQSMMDQIIFKKCSSAMEADYKAASKTPPDGLVSKMCNCVVKEISKLHSIEGAKNVCVAEIGVGS